MDITKLNPRTIMQHPPGRPELGKVVIVIDCPCRKCALPYVLRDVPNAPDKLVELTADEWNTLVGNYTSTSDECRVVPAAGCSWVGLIKGGKILDFDGKARSNSKDESAADVLTKVKDRIERGKSGVVEVESVRGQERGR